MAVRLYNRGETSALPALTFAFRSVSRVAGLVIVIAFAGCTHAGGGPARPVPAPPPPPPPPPAAPAAPAAAPMPDSLVVAFTDSTDSLPARLEASGHYQRAPGTHGAARLLRLKPGEGEGEGGGYAPLLIVKAIAPRDARDALDVGVDVLVTADPAAVAYAATRADLVSVALGWDRTYVLLAPGGPVPNATPAADSLLAALRVELAANAVRAEARSSVTTFRPADEDTCAPSTPNTTTTTTTTDAGTPRIVYDRADDVARALATRLVALASDRGGAGTLALAAGAPSLVAAGGTLRADGVASADFARALAARDATAFVLALSTHAGACGERAELGRMAPWVAATHTAPVALVDIRSRIIARRTVTGLPFAWLGAPPDTLPSAP